MMVLDTSFFTKFWLAQHMATRTNKRQVSARRTTSTDPYSVPQASEAQMNVLQVKEQEVKQTAIRQFSLEGNEHMTTTRSRQLVEVAQSQIHTFLPQERSQPR